MSYNWIITHDPINTGAVGVTGPLGSTFDWTKNPNAGEAFKMYDDDGELYYLGRIVGDYDGFEPLDDFGEPNAGCTSIKYRDPNTNKWETL